MAHLVRGSGAVPCFIVGGCGRDSGAIPGFITGRVWCDGWVSIPPGLRGALCFSFLCSRIISGGIGIYTCLGGDWVGVRVSPWDRRGMMGLGTIV